MKMAIICTVGDSILPLIEHINELKPDLVYFIHSSKTEQSSKDIQKKTNVSEYRFALLKNYEDVYESFSKSSECIDELFKEDFEVIGNFTAGTKTMSVGLAMACVEKNCQYDYGTGNRDQSGSVKTYESSITQENPYEKNAINEFKRGKLFFDNYQFLAALENFNQAENKLKVQGDDLNHLKLQSEIFIKIIEFYDAWDKFNDELEGIKLNQMLKNIIMTINSNETLLNYFLNELPNFFKQMKNNLKFLDKKLDSNIFYYLPDLLNNADRRIHEGKYDDAVARLYRSIELVAQLQLIKFRIVDENSFINEKSFLIDKSKVERKTSKKTQFQISNINKKMWKANDLLEYAMNNDYLILEYLSDEKNNDLCKSTKDLVAFYKNIKNRVQVRNKSILAHGLKPLNEQDATSMYKSVLRHSQKLCSNVEKEMELCKFPLFREG